MVISIKHYQSKKKLYFLLNSFIFFGLNSIFTFNFQSFPWWHIFPSSIIYISPLFSKSTRSQADRTPKKNSIERKNIILDLPFPCRETHCLLCENSDVYVQAIADLRFGRRPHQVSRDWDLELIIQLSIMNGFSVKTNISPGNESYL